MEPPIDQALRTFYAERAAEMEARWHRSVSFGDLVVDRWERARSLGFGAGASIYDSALVLGDVRVGEQTWIGPFTVLDGSGGLEIGAYCSISAGVQLYTHDTVEWAVSGGVAGPARAPTRIGSRCYIGPNTVVAKGVTIGDGCIIGAGSLVLRDVPAGSRAVGAPCRVIGAVARDPSGASPDDGSVYLAPLAHDAHAFEIRRRGDASPVGVGELRNVDDAGGVAALVVRSDVPNAPDDWRTAAMRLLLDVAFRSVGLRRVTIAVPATDDAARRGAEGAGFRVEGVQRQAQRVEGAYVDVVLLAVLRQEYDAGLARENA